MSGRGDISSDFRRKFLFSFVMFLAILTSGTLGFSLIAPDGHSLVDAFYMTVITVTTVGYGEIIDLSGNPAGRIFTVVLIFCGMGVILYFISNVTAFLIEADINEIFRRKRMQKFISRMKDHYIVCGAGTIGIHIAEELSLTHRGTVVVDMDKTRLDALGAHLPEVGTIEGDAAGNDVLVAAGIERAAGLIAATDNDKDNLVVTLTARQMRPDLRVVARCNDTRNTEKLRRAGADAVVSSNYIGGLRMASEMVRPEVVGFLDKMLRDKDRSLRIEEALVPGGSALSGMTAGQVRERVLLLAVRTAPGQYVYNPPGGFAFAAGMHLIFMGGPEDREAIEKLAGIP